MIYSIGIGVKAYFQAIWYTISVRIKAIRMRLKQMFFKVVKTAFQQRRKTMRNSLKVFNLSNKLKEDAIFGQRPEQLSVSQFIALTQKLENDAISTNNRLH